MPRTVPEGLEGGKFENLNRVLAAAPSTEPDWLLAIDDDVRLPSRFLDRFIALCERFALDLATARSEITAQLGN